MINMNDDDDDDDEHEWWWWTWTMMNNEDDDDEHERWWWFDLPDHTFYVEKDLGWFLHPALSYKHEKLFHETWHKRP